MDNLTKSLILTPFNLLYKISPELDLKLLFWLKQRYKLNLKKPVTYNEKLQWIKLHDKNPLMPKCCDKYAVREYVEEQGCGHMLNGLLWEGFDPENIPFDSLPEKFVIKVTCGSTYNIICTDKKSLNRDKAIASCKKWLKAKFLPCYGEWFYGQVPPRVIVENYIESDDGEQLRDYKIFCFHGIPRYIRVDSDRFTGHKMDIFTTDWQRLSGVHTGYGCSDYPLEEPPCLKEILEAASKLAVPFLHARVDFYSAGGKAIFGEITFTNGAGFDKFSSYDFDKEMGSWLTLPVINGK